MSVLKLRDATPFVGLLVFLAVQCLQAQTQIDLRMQAKNIDFSEANSTRPMKIGTVLPATCSVGEAFFKRDAPAGKNLYGCAATNTWALQGSDGGDFSGDVIPSGGNWDLSNATSLKGKTGSADPVTCARGELFFNSVTSVQKVCTAPNTWTPLREVVPGTGISIGHSGGTATISSDPLVVLSRPTHQAGTDLYCNDNQTIDSYACNLIPVLNTYTAGMFITFRPNTSNTGAATLNINNLGSRAIKQANGTSDLVDNALTSGRLYTLYYDGNVFRMQQDLVGGDTIGGSATSIQGNEVAAGTPAGNGQFYGWVADNTQFKLFSFGSGLSVAGTEAVVDSSIVMLLTGPQTVTGRKTFTEPVVGCAPLPSSPTPGQLACDSTDGNTFKQFDGMNWRKSAVAGSTLTSGAILAGNGSNSITTVTSTGTGDVVRSSAPTITTPVIGDFVNASHNHQNAAGGGQLSTGALEDGAVTMTKVESRLKQRLITLTLGDRHLGDPLLDTQDLIRAFRTILGPFRVIEIGGYSDAGTPTINVRRNDGSPADLLSSALSLSTSYACARAAGDTVSGDGSTTCSGTLSAAERDFLRGHELDVLIVSAGGAAKEITLHILIEDQP